MKVFCQGENGQMSEMVKFSFEILEETHVGYLALEKKKTVSICFLSNPISVKEIQMIY